jgi:hypothetical protein
MDKTLEEYLLENHPQIIKEYSAYLNRRKIPKLGDRVVTLRSGFGGGVGVIRFVKEYRVNPLDSSCNEIILGDKRDWRTYISNEDTWYKDFEVIK